MDQKTLKKIEEERRKAHDQAVRFDPKTQPEDYYFWMGREAALVALALEKIDQN